MFRLEGKVPENHVPNFARDYLLILRTCEDSFKATEDISKRRYNRRGVQPFALTNVSLWRRALLRRDPIYAVLRKVARDRQLPQDDRKFSQGQANLRRQALFLAENPYKLVKEAKEALGEPNHLKPRYSLGT